MDDWRWPKSEKLWVGKVQLKAGEVMPVVETVEKVEPKNADRKENKEKLARGGGAAMKCNPQLVAALKVLVAAKYSGINVKESFLFVIDSVRYNLTSCFIKVEKSFVLVTMLPA